MLAYITAIGYLFFSLAKQGQTDMSVKRSFCERSSCFSYQGSGGSNGETLTGAGILCL